MRRGWGIALAWVEPGSFVIHPVARALADPALTARSDELRASWDRTMGVMNEGGTAPAEEPRPAPGGSPPGLADE